MDLGDGSRCGVADRTNGRPGAGWTWYRSCLQSGKELLGLLRSGKEELLHVVEQELLSFWHPKVQAVVVDQLLLGFQPFGPAYAANFLVRFPAQVVLEGLECHPFAIQPTSSAVQCRHHAKQDRHLRKCDPVYRGAAQKTLESLGSESPMRGRGIAYRPRPARRSEAGTKTKRQS